MQLLLSGQLATPTGFAVNHYHLAYCQDRQHVCPLRDGTFFDGTTIRAHYLFRSMNIQLFRNFISQCQATCQPGRLYAEEIDQPSNAMSNFVLNHEVLDRPAWRP